VEFLDDSHTKEAPVLHHSATSSYRFATSTPLPLLATFDGGRITSDGGLPLLAEADTALHLSARFAACIPDWRRGPVRHSLQTLLRQRIFQIACGYEDQNDADSLRPDPLLKLVCGRLPLSGAPLASQPTLSRLENAITRRTCYRLASALVELYLRERERDGRPTHILLDLDGTDDPTYGEQEGTAYHAYYRQHMYHPLLLFDGETNQLILAVLRPGKVHASRGVVALLKRLIPVLQRRWPGVRISLRADSGFAVPALYDYCEERSVHYTIGLVPNSRLQALAAPVQAEARRQQQESGAEKVRHIDEGEYQAESWFRARRVVLKAELLPKGPNLRFVVTNRSEAAPAVYDAYVERGEAENWIKDLKNACRADRLSCHRFVANQFRLLLHGAAYWLLDTLRRWLTRAGAQRMQLDSLRLVLLKIGGRVLEVLDQVRLRLASSHPGQILWNLLASRHLMNNPG
jgi:hypothetical protein